MMSASTQLRNADLILFDLDGTLVDSVPDIANALNDMLTSQALPHASLEQVRNWIGNGARILVDRALQHLQHTVTEVPVFHGDQAFSLFLEAYHQRNGEHTLVFPHAIDLLERYGETRKAIVTNKPEAHTHSLLHRLNLHHHFNWIAGGDTYPEQKPSPEPLLRLIELAGAERPVLIGDSVNDVRAAKSAGIPVIGVSYGYNHGQPIQHENPDWVVDSLAELL